MGVTSTLHMLYWGGMGSGGFKTLVNVKVEGIVKVLKVSFSKFEK